MSFDTRPRIIVTLFQEGGYLKLRILVLYEVSCLAVDVGLTRFVGLTVDGRTEWLRKFQVVDFTLPSRVLMNQAFPSCAELAREESTM